MNTPTFYISLPIT